MIDSREVPFELVAMLAISGPMVAVNQAPSPRPWHGFAYAPLSFVANAYRHAGAEVHNIVDDPDMTAWFDAHPPGPIAEVLPYWALWRQVPRVSVASPVSCFRPWSA